jgi:hypothetical protein
MVQSTSIISIVKERINKRQELTFDFIILWPRLSKEEIDTLSTYEAQIYT